MYRQNKSSESRESFRQASNRCKKVLEAALLAYANKTKESITAQKRGSQDFWGMIILFSTKVNLPYLLYSSVQRCCLLYLINQNYLWETFLSNLAVASSCQIELLHKLQKWIYRTITSSLAASLDPFAYRWNIARLSLFCRYYFGRCSSELAALIPLFYSRGRSTRCFDRLHDFSVNIPRCYKDVYVNSFFPWPTRLWNSLPIKCFPLTYDINGFKSSFNCKFFLNRFPVCFNLFFYFFFL